MGPDLNWFKSYDTKRKIFNFRFFATTTIRARARVGNDILYMKQKKTETAERGFNYLLARTMNDPLYHSTWHYLKPT